MIPAEIYQPAEDSYLLSEVLRKIKVNKDDKILDMGSGSGIQAKTILSLNRINPQNLLLIDINNQAIAHLKKTFKNLKVKIKKSNLFQNIQGKFNIILFNPPYLPEEKGEPKSSQLATTGGKYGSEVINKFLKQATRHLEKDGKIILLTSSHTKKICWNNFKKKKLATKNIFFEKLWVWELKK
jgi:release factor glutamine methyltransferase